MRNVITVMNAKGGVGKSTLVLTLAETLSAHQSLRVLVIDSDAHASLSSMLISPNWFATLQSEGTTFVDYLIASVLNADRANWRNFVIEGVSDVDDARSVDLLLGGGHLTLFEREISKGNHEAGLRRTIRAFLAEARAAYDIVLIDSAPGLSILTECWLREADFCLSPAKPDYLSTRGLQFLQQFGQRDAQMGFSESLGIIISMKDALAPEDAKFERWLRHNIKAHCFKQVIPRTAALQAAAHFSLWSRSYAAKYPGKTGRVLRDLGRELVARLAAAQTRPVEAGERSPHGPSGPGDDAANR